MLSDNIKKYRKEKNLSQDELAEKLGVSRQSISLWENGQTQPTIDNIISLAKIFNVSTDALLENEVPAKTAQQSVEKKKSAAPVAITIAIAVVVCVGIAIAVFGGHSNTTVQPNEAVSEAPDSAAVSSITVETEAQTQTQTQTVDIFACCKEFAIQKGNLNGDYCIYQQPAELYGGYPDEFFSVAYWADSDMVEFCLHCPLSETQSINFYLRMRGAYDHQYEYAVSKYFRDGGNSLRFATGTIDPAVFSDAYPLNCEKYEGDFDGQDDFMEESRVGMCDLIYCLKNFTEAENLGCTFADFEFVNF